MYKTVKESGFLLLSNNTEAFIARFMMISAARYSLDVQYYMINNDASGQLLTYAMLQAADRGVRVRILVDDINLSGRDNRLKMLGQHENIQIRIFNPLVFRDWFRNLELLLNLDKAGRRMHNKLFIVDDKTAIIGGRNIGDEYFDARSTQNFVDLDLLVEGPITGDLNDSFGEYWCSTWAMPIEQLSKLKVVKSQLAGIRKRMRDYYRRTKNTQYFKSVYSSKLTGKILNHQLEYIRANAQLYYDKPEKLRNRQQNIVHFGEEIMPLFNQARYEILISTPYFVPGIPGSDWLINKIKQNVNIEVLTNALSTTDVIAVHAGYRKYRPRLLNAGLRLYELKRDATSRPPHPERILGQRSYASLHAKYIVIDRRHVLIGSANLDPRSSNLNTEIAIHVDSPELAQEVIELFRLTTQMENSYHLELENRRLTWTTKRDQQLQVYHDEPETNLFKKLAVFLISLLPIENQL